MGVCVCLFCRVQDYKNLHISLNTVNPEIFAIILFSRIALKYIFTTLKNHDYGMIYLPISVNDRVISAFHDFILRSKNKILAKIFEFTILACMYEVHELLLSPQPWCKHLAATYCLSVPLFVHFSFSPMEISVTDFSAPIEASVLKFCVHLKVVVVYLLGFQHLAVFRISIAEDQIAHASVTSESSKKIQDLEEQLQTLSEASNK